MTADDRPSVTPRVGDTITTAEQLDALPVGSWIGLVRHEQYRPFEKVDDETWLTPGVGVWFDEDWLPVTVLYVPSEPSRPSVTDNARAQVDPYLVDRHLARVAAAVEDYRKVYPEPHALSPNLELAAVGARLLAAGRAETTTATDEDAAVLAVLNALEPRAAAPSLDYWGAKADEMRAALRAAGLLATARTRPTETEWGVRGQHAGSITPQHSKRHAEAIANALPYYSVVRREVTDWTEVDR